MTSPSRSEPEAAGRVKRYYIRVHGFDGHVIDATSASKARYREWLALKDAGYGRHQTFRDFLRLIETFHHHGPVPGR